MAVKLRHGVFMAPFHRTDENPTLLFRQDLRLMELLDDLGFQEAWIGEHHSAGMETIASPELFIAAAAERTRHLRLGTGVVSLPYHNPLMVADRIVQLDHMTQGRVMFGAGPGLLASDALMLGIDPAVQRDRMAEALDVILRLFRGEVVTERTDWYELVEARLHLPPYSDPHPEVCVASAVTPSGGRLAGRYDLGMLCVAAGENAGFDALDVNWRVANEVATEHGRTMDPSRLRLVVGMHLAETREEARAQARHGLQAQVDYLNNNMPRIFVPDGVDLVEWYAEQGAGVIGTPDDAIARIERLQQKMPGFGALLLNAHDWATWENTKRSYELYARYVIPHFERSNAPRQASYRWVTEHRSELTEKRTAAARAMFDKHEAEWAAKRSGNGADTPSGNGARPEAGRESTFG
ncbi:LLM class flavin-dependent oxidoreductase [Pseudonocardia sp. NPDC049154]|uniref:LLM class flavin-dependent oxidoreductase n=1 Tax=Pseudonocardia sp. NPDC049154 TaxID=3155501 RepID=UPI0033F95D71